MQLADVFLYHFQSSVDPTKKEVIIEELPHFSVTYTKADDNIREFHVNMLRANMLRTMSPAKKYQTRINELSSKCICGLPNSVFWNDSSSLRLLCNGRHMA